MNLFLLLSLKTEPNLEDVSSSFQLRWRRVACSFLSASMIMGNKRDELQILVEMQTVDSFFGLFSYHDTCVHPILDDAAIRTLSSSANSRRAAGQSFLFLTGPSDVVGVPQLSRLKERDNFESPVKLNVHVFALWVKTQAETAKLQSEQDSKLFAPFIILKSHQGNSFAALQLIEEFVCTVCRCLHVVQVTLNSGLKHSDIQVSAPIYRNL